MKKETKSNYRKKKGELVHNTNDNVFLFYDFYLFAMKALWISLHSALLRLQFGSKNIACDERNLRHNQHSPVITCNIFITCIKALAVFEINKCRLVYTTLVVFVDAAERRYRRGGSVYFLITHRQCAVGICSSPLFLYTYIYIKSF
jgi:hypothetical protein